MSAFRQRLGYCLLWLGACAPAALAPPGRAQPSEKGADGRVKELARIRAKGLITFFAFAPDGKALAYGDALKGDDQPHLQTELVLLDLATGKELKRSAPEEGFTTTAVFSPDGKLLVLGLRRQPIVWDVGRWKQSLVVGLPEKHRFGQALACSPDGKLIAGLSGPLEGGRDLGLWDLATGKCRPLAEKKEQKEGQPYLPGSYRPSFLPHAQGGRFAEDGSPYLFAEYPSWRTRIWDLASGQPAWPYLPGRSDDLRGCVTTPGGRVLPLPKYDRLPFLLPLSAVPDPDGTADVLVVVTPSGDRLGWTPQPGKPDKELWRCEGFRNSDTPSFALSPDGKRLVVLGDRSRSPSTLRVWDVSGLHPVAAKEAAKPTRAELERWWSFLFKEHHDPDYRREEFDALTPPALVLDLMTAQEQLFYAHRAMTLLVRHPDEGVAYLRKQLGPPADPKGVPALLAALDSDVFATREQATRELARLGHAALPALEKALKGKLSAEQKRRIEPLVEKLRPTAASYEFRQLRILDVLEHIDSREARDLLQAFADGKYDPAFADEAKKALKRRADKP